MDPGKLDPTAAEDKPFEIFSKLWDQGAQQAQTKRGADTAARIAKEAARGKMKGPIGNRSIDECGAN